MKRKLLRLLLAEAFEEGVAHCAGQALVTAIAELRLLGKS